jgi:hypothetical protein
LSKPQSHGEIQQKVKAKNPYPVIGHTELQTELQKSHNSYEAIKQAVKRAIEEGQETGNPPWPMRGCAAEYRIVKSEIKKGRSKPTPASCKYQKIYREEED